MHVDGFRFDLASVLGRDNAANFVPSAAFFLAVAQDPVLCRVKLIAEPWDLGTYQVGKFPVEWSEWNGRYRDTARRFLRGDGGVLGELGWRLTGSADLYGDDGRSPHNSINFITCHDGFTLNDLYSYNRKHNDTNGEGNIDGTNENHSWNCGVEGSTIDPSILQLRRRLAKNAFCLLIFSSGTPMILGGDEFLRTQHGNNNAYCQDSETSWFDWSLLDTNREMFEFARRVIRMARAYPAVRRRRFFSGADPTADGIPDISWYGADGGAPAWHDPAGRTLCCRLDGRNTGATEHPYELFLIFHSGEDSASIVIPPTQISGGWRLLIDTSLPPGMDIAEPGGGARLEPQSGYFVNGRSVALFAAGSPQE
jgi:glycogen operon protein